MYGINIFYNSFRIQFRILKRGLELLNVGGRLVYSTCSFNPVENEAVVQRMLTEAEGIFTSVLIILTYARMFVI